MLEHLPGQYCHIFWNMGQKTNKLYISALSVHEFHASDLGHYTTLYRFLDGQKRTASNLTFQDFKGFIGTKNIFFFNSREGFFRKSPLCTFSYINPGFGGPWGILWIFFVIFIIFKRMLLAKKIFKFHAKVQKWHFGKIEKLAKSIPLKRYENGNKKKYP